MTRVAAEYLTEPKSPSGIHWPLSMMVRLRLAQEEEAAKAAAASSDPSASSNPAGLDEDRDGAAS